MEKLNAILAFRGQYTFSLLFFLSLRFRFLIFDFILFFFFCIYFCTEISPHIWMSNVACIHHTEQFLSASSHVYLSGWVTVEVDFWFLSSVFSHFHKMSDPGKIISPVQVVYRVLCLLLLLQIFIPFFIYL